MTFVHELQRQRWDDHRYYHHNRVNQSLHLLSAMCFVASYAILFVWPGGAALVGWLLAMVLRQAGHFFFEPKTYDEVAKASHEYKESVKVGYNLRRKVVLLSVWAVVTVAMVVDPTLAGTFAEPAGAIGVIDNIAIAWLVIGLGAVVFRTVHLCFLMGVQSALVWFTKILTDPFHDIRIYRMAPIHLLRGEIYDDMSDWYDRSVYSGGA